MDFIDGMFENGQNEVWDNAQFVNMQLLILCVVCSVTIGF